MVPRFTLKEEIRVPALLDAIRCAESGQIDADLGGEVLKQRVARPGEGKSKGYRIIIFFRRGSRAFLMYGYSKSQRSNIDEIELREFRNAARYVLNLSEMQLSRLVNRV